nr:discoidin domain-containing protein [Bacteroidota bacterium]
QENVRFLPVPVLAISTKVFDDSTLIDLKSNSPVFYSRNILSDSVLKFEPFIKPFYINRSSVIHAFASDGKSFSDTIRSVLYKRPNSWNVTYTDVFNSQYTAGGTMGLIDGLHGDLNWRKGEWQGFQYKDLEIVIDLGKKTKISEIRAGFLQDTRAWILMPKMVEFYFSSDNLTFELAGTVINVVKSDNYDVQIQNLVLKLKKSQKARYVKVKAINYGKLPGWHQGYGDSAFIFADEITIR